MACVQAEGGNFRNLLYSCTFKLTVLNLVKLMIM